MDQLHEITKISYVNTSYYEICDTIILNTQRVILPDYHKLNVFNLANLLRYDLVQVLLCL